ncbi:hypothetical protein B0T16DRAFT_334973 [Cercophora newfieldiana]|uniref:DUF1993 domain-containing protein n=1 Tax=Cercophora newfieldiana TaxID=92897 RepID=A0AA39XVR4_9PEZI|nr:hypothetical protein B0T16DRAFT_334973 [Cercophora newfieldiana]
MATLDTTDYVLGTFNRGLNTLTHILEVAEAHARENNVDFDAEWLPTRLIDDMKPLSFQLQNATSAIKLHLARLTGDAYPYWEDNEKTLEEFKARIAQTKEFLEAVDRAKLKERLEAGMEVEMNWGSLKVKTKAGYAAVHHGIPNFLFHVQTTYAILRSKGVPLGKKDYIEEFFNEV